MTDKLTGYMYSWEVIDLGMAQLNIIKPREELTDADIRQIIRWVGMCAVDSILTEEKPIWGRIGIGLMLTVTLLEFPEYYVKYELSQFN